MSDVKKLDESENRDVIDGWYTQADEMKPAKLQEFLRHLMEDFDHDYGTIVHAITAGALATAWALNRGPQGGITGFQAGFVGSGFYGKWQHIEGPWMVRRFEDLLYNQYEDKFEKLIDQNTADWLKEQADEKLVHPNNAGVREDLKAHWNMIAAGILPFGFKIRQEEEPNTMTPHMQRKVEATLHEQGYTDDGIDTFMESLGLESNRKASERIKAAIKDSGYEVLSPEETEEFVEKAREAVEDDGDDPA